MGPQKKFSQVLTQQIRNWTGLNPKLISFSSSCLFQELESQHARVWGWKKAEISSSLLFMDEETEFLNKYPSDSFKFTKYEGTKPKVKVRIIFTLSFGTLSKITL